MEDEEIVKDDSLEVKVDEGQENVVVENEADNPEATEEEEELIVSIGDEEPEVIEDDSSVIKGFREREKKKSKRIKELESELQKYSVEKKPIELGEEPTLESCDYDSTLLKTKLREYDKRKANLDKANAEKKEAEETQAKDWQSKVDAYTEAKTSLKVKNFDEVEEIVKEKIDENRQGIILHVAKESALSIYALGKNSKKLDDLAKIKDPLKFAYAVGQMEAQLKVTNRKKPPAPEKRLSSSGGTAGITDKTEDRLREKAMESGDFTELHKYRKEQRNK